MYRIQCIENENKMIPNCATSKCQQIGITRPTPKYIAKPFGIILRPNFPNYSEIFTKFVIFMKIFMRKPTKCLTS